MVYVHSMTDTAEALSPSIRQRMGNSFLGKRTVRGYVIREIEAGRTKNQWFIYDQGGGNLAQPKLMKPLMPGEAQVFKLVTDQTEIETVMFFARRAIAILGD